MIKEDGNASTREYCNQLSFQSRVLLSKQMFANMCWAWQFKRDARGGPLRNFLFWTLREPINLLMVWRIIPYGLYDLWWIFLLNRFLLRRDMRMKYTFTNWWKYR